MILSHLYTRDISIRGFTCETLSAILADIESREWRRHFNRENSTAIEHPRASTTDDVECCFSILRDIVGKDFTLKDVYNVQYGCCQDIRVGRLSM